MFSPHRKQLRVLDLDTQEVKTYPSQKAYAQVIGFSGTVVNHWVKDPLHLPILGRYLLKNTSDKTAWRIPTQEEREVYFRHYILVRDPYTGEVLEFTNATACAKHFNTNRSVPHARCHSSGQIVFVDGFQYKRKNDKTPWRIFSATELDCLEWRKNGEAYLAGKKL